MIELLVATAVLVLLVVLVAQLTNSTSTVIVGSRRHLDADSQARMIFDRMANDFAKMPRRTDLDYLFSNQSTGSSPNDAMYFYSEAPAYYEGSASDFTNRSSTGLIGYRINAAWQLERLGKLLTWDGSAASATPGAVVYLGYPTPAAGPSPSATPTPYYKSTLIGNWPAAVGVGGTDPDFHVLGEQVFRLAFCFLLKPYVATVAGTSSPYPGFYSVNPYNPLIPAHASVTSVQGTGLQDVEAIVVAIAVLDSTSRKIVPATSVTVNGSPVQAANLSSLAQVFPDPTSSDLQTPTAPTTSPPAPTLMAQKWMGAMNSGTFAPPSIPQTASSQVHIYQRIFYLK